jgi:metal-responsive CopG/Arc/MetJ family transcriptional regulator
MTIAKNKEKISSWDRHITVNISIPLKVLAAIDEQVTPGKRSEFIKDILLKSLKL